MADVWMHACGLLCRIVSSHISKPVEEANLSASNGCHRGVGGNLDNTNTTCGLRVLCDTTKVRNAPPDLHP
eukprot:910734-Karenia_brevis.AAC.1